METARNIVAVLLILAITAFVLTLMIFGVRYVIDSPNVDQEQCGMRYCATPEVLVCPVVVMEQPTATSTAVLCECNCATETPVILTATPTLPPNVTRTPGPSPTPGPSSTPELTSTPEASPTPMPTSTHIPPEPTDKPKCNRGLGNNEEGCDPGNSGGKPGNAGEGNEPGGPGK